MILLPPPPPSWFIYCCFAKAYNFIIWGELRPNKISKINRYLNTLMNIPVNVLLPDAACPRVHRVLILYVDLSGLGHEMSGGVPKPPDVPRPPSRRIPASDHPSNNPSHMWSSGKTDAVSPFVKSSCWTAVSFMGSVRKEVGIKVTVLFMRIVSINVGAAGPSRDSELNNETRLRPSTASHLLRAAVCTFRCTSQVELMMGGGVTCYLGQIRSYTKLTFWRKTVNDMADLSHSFSRNSFKAVNKT